MNRPSDTFGVYRVFGGDDEALYVGTAQNPWGRMTRHAVQNKQMCEASRVELTWHPTATEARKVERAEIERLKPTFNVEYVNDGRRRRWGELKLLIIAAVEELGECTSSDVRVLLNKEERRTLHPQEIGAVMSRLRVAGILDVVGKTAGSDSPNGHPQFIVKVAA